MANVKASFNDNQDADVSEKNQADTVGDPSRHKALSVAKRWQHHNRRNQNSK
jgi:hypothetical protein